MRDKGRQTCEIIDNLTEIDTETKICETSGAVDRAAAVIASQQQQQQQQQ
jgi:hypothetical protein